NCGWPTDMLSLIVEADGEAPRALRLTRFPSVIGRQPDCAVRLPSWRVARAHAEIHRIEHGFKLVDRGSLGGTRVNGERIVEYAPLDDDDEIAIAGYRLRVHPGAGRRGAAARAADRVLPRVETESMIAPAAPVPRGDLEWRRLLHRRLLAAIDLRRQDVRQLNIEQLRREVQALLLELLASEA